MLKVLHIRNFALMADLTVDFDKGLTVITGETGAGKSMVVEAIAALCGDRMDDISIRSGKDFAEITGVFDIKPALVQRLKKSGIEIEQDLIIRRKIERGKRQYSFINDQLISLGLLRDLAQEMVDLIGQYENQSLFFPKNHLVLLDAYAGLADLKSQYTNNFREFRSLQNRLASLLETIKQKDEKIDYLKYQINEIEKTDLKPNEEGQLDLEKKLLLSSEKRSVLSQEIVTTLYEGEGSVIENLFKVKESLDELSGFDPNLTELKERLENAISTIDDIYRELNSYHNKIEFSQERLDYVLERVEVVNKIKKKYGKTIDEIRGYLGGIKNELTLIETKDEEIEKIKGALNGLEKKVIGQAENLSLKRRKFISPLKKKILELLAHLGMEKADFDIRINEKHLEEDGKDEVEFYISTNPGEELKPLRRVASGGEISRITLCLKTILSEVDKIPTVIFDEVDTGIGGRIAEAVGDLLAMVSKGHQVVCVTHLPQITMFADNHILVKKEVKDKETFAHIIKLDDAMRKLEIARMLGGKDITKKTMAHAAEILQKGKQK